MTFFASVGASSKPDYQQSVKLVRTHSVAIGTKSQHRDERFSARFYQGDGFKR
jgi:hypothetical protein